MATIQSMLKPQASSLPGHIQAVYVHNILKLIAATFSKEDEINTETMQQVHLNFFVTVLRKKRKEKILLILFLFSRWPI